MFPNPINGNLQHRPWSGAEVLLFVQSKCKWKSVPSVLFLIWVVWPKDLRSDAYIGVFTMAVAASFLTSSANKNRMGVFYSFLYTGKGVCFWEEESKLFSFLPKI